MLSRVVTLAELFPARTIRFVWSHSSSVSRFAKFSLTSRPPDTNFNYSKITTTHQLFLLPSKATSLPARETIVRGLLGFRTPAKTGVAICWDYPTV